MRAGWDEWIIVLISRPGETKQRKPFTMHYRDMYIMSKQNLRWDLAVLGIFYFFSCVSQLFIGLPSLRIKLHGILRDIPGMYRVEVYTRSWQNATAASEPCSLSPCIIFLLHCSTQGGIVVHSQPGDIQTQFFSRVKVSLISSQKQWNI